MLCGWSGWGIDGILPFVVARTGNYGLGRVWMGRLASPTSEVRDVCPLPYRLRHPRADRAGRPGEQPRGTTAMAIRDHLDGLWSDEDFEKWHPRDGKPGLSPAQLATVSVLQFLLELSDRQAAEFVRNRIDWKYALGMELEGPGFHHSVLAGFRERLAEEGRVDKLLGLALEKIRAVGLVRDRGRQRTDARTVTFLPRELYDLQSESRTEQQTQEWVSRYSVRAAAVESTISEFVKWPRHAPVPLPQR